MQRNKEETKLYIFWFPLIHPGCWARLGRKTVNQYKVTCNFPFLEDYIVARNCRCKIEFRMKTLFFG